MHDRRRAATRRTTRLELLLTPEEARLLAADAARATEGNLSALLRRAWREWRAASTSRPR